MSLNDLEKQWSHANAPRLWEWLVVQQGWMANCREAVRQGDQALLHAWWNAASDLPPNAESGRKRQVFAYAARQGADRMLQTHLLCALVACQAQAIPLPSPTVAPDSSAHREARQALTASLCAHPLPSDLPIALECLAKIVQEEGRWLDSRDAGTLAEALLTALIRHNVHGMADLPPNLLRDLTRTLLEQPLCPPEETVRVQVLLIHSALNRGVPATLTLERMPEGTGRLYPARDLLLRTRDEAWQQAEANACAAVLVGVVLPGDFRWSLERLDGKPLPVGLEGDSAGADFAMALARLAGTIAPDLWPLLDLETVALTATIDAGGHLGTVGGVWEKLLAAAQEAATMRALSVVVVADTQRKEVPVGLLAPESTPLRVLPADTLAEAVRLLYQEQGPRAAVRRLEQEQCKDLMLPLGRAPITTHFQTLPLLQKVEAEALPRDLRAPGDDRLNEPSGLRAGYTALGGAAAPGTSRL